MQETQLILLAASQVLYAGAVAMAMWVIDRGKRDRVPHLAVAVIVSLLGFTAAGFVALPTAIAGMICYTLIATVYLALPEYWRRQVRYGGMALGLLAGFHQVPGIHGVPLYSRWWEYGSNLLAFNFDLDKAYAGLLLALIAAQFHPQKQSWRPIWIIPVGIAGLLVVVWLAGYPLQPTVPQYAAAFIFVNLMQTCFAEELFFRGALQRELMLYLAPGPAIAITAVLFGLVHLSRGWEFALITMLSGLLHGWVYRRTGVLSLSVLSHFLVNVAWIMLFPSVGNF
jgi:membrane protease YdiL (CAAX protease family)